MNASQKGTDCLQKSFNAIFFSSSGRKTPIKAKFIAAALLCFQW